MLHITTSTLIYLTNSCPVCPSWSHSTYDCVQQITTEGHTGWPVQPDMTRTCEDRVKLPCFSSQVLLSSVWYCGKTIGLVPMGGKVLTLWPSTAWTWTFVSSSTNEGTDSRVDSGDRPYLRRWGHTGEALGFLPLLSQNSFTFISVIF